MGWPGYLGREEEILTYGMENTHFVCVRLGDVQDQLVLSKDIAGTLSPQQHHRHVLEVYGGKATRRGDVGRFPASSTACGLCYLFSMQSLVVHGFIGQT